ncbi:glutamate receptor-like protein [Trifolium pratense]|uniref:Glutamate receptor-like protein n=1 Tax=Trifolium pratense TaxID=57577 RepID=A0A2K3PHL1_TRIPR|nr:glutamate receptor-like protein [Trifolium pratense]
MEKTEIVKPITTTLIGQPSYNIWVQGMKSFLIGRKLWRIVTRDVIKPTREKNESDTKFAKRLEEWDSKNHQIITWLRNTSLWTTLLNTKLLPGQSVNDFLAQVQPIWHQISFAKISEDHLHLIQFLMALRPEYEAVRASLLHRNPLPSLDTAIQEIIFEETQNCPRQPPKQNCGFNKSKNVPKSGSSSISTAATKGSTAITMSDIEALIKQVMSSNTSIVMSATHGNSRWFFDSACCNHTTTDIKSLPSVTLVSSLPPIHTAIGNTMNITHTGHVSTSNLTLPDTYYLPNLTLNLISVGQLCEQGLNVYFSPSGVQVQDPQTKQIIGTGRRVVSKALRFNVHVLTPPNKMVRLNENIVTSLTQIVLFSYQPRVQKSFGGLMSAQNYNRVLTCVYFLVMAHNTKDIVVGIQSPTYYASHVMLPFGKTPCSPLFLHFIILLALTHFISLIPQLSCFQLNTRPPSPAPTEPVSDVDIVPASRHSTRVKRYKARIVAKGYTQEYGIDYEETFAPVAQISYVRILLAIAAVRKWKLFQMDVKNAFLHGDLTEEVYMHPHLVLSSPHDSALFARRSDSGIVILLLYVDDMIITGDDKTEISTLQQYLSHHFEMKDLGSLSYFVGLGVSQDSEGYYLSQAKYASDLLSRAGITDCKTELTPLEVNCKLTPLDDTPLEDATLYRQLVGSLVYLTVTRPDIKYVVHKFSQFMAAPRSSHFYVVLRIIRYVKGTLFHGLRFSANSILVLSGYSDADWAGDSTDRRSTTRYCFFLGSSLLSWRSKKQTVVARSSTKSEYRALADATSELHWLWWLLNDIAVTQSSATMLHCDNRSAIQISHNDVFHERTKHIEIDCHLVRHHVTNGTISLISIPAVDQVADIFTKTHHPVGFKDLSSKLQLASTVPTRV